MRDAVFRETDLRHGPRERSEVPTTWLFKCGWARQKSQVVAGLLRDSVVLCGALG